MIAKYQWCYKIGRLVAEITLISVMIRMMKIMMMMMMLIEIMIMMSLR